MDMPYGPDIFSSWFLIENMKNILSNMGTLKDKTEPGYQKKAMIEQKLVFIKLIRWWIWQKQS